MTYRRRVSPWSSLRRNSPHSAALNAGFDEIPEEYDDLRSAGHMSRRRTEVVAALVADSTGPVVELGSGTGTLLRELARRFPERRFVGTEPLTNYVEFARKRAQQEGLTNVTFEAAPAEKLSSVLEPAAAGMVLSVDTLHHVQDVDHVIAEVAAASAPGAHWHAMEPNRLHPYVLAYHVLTPGERTFPAADFTRRAARQGWRLAGRSRLFLYPSGVRRVPPWAVALEQRLEPVPVLAGGVLLDLVRG